MKPKSRPPEPNLSLKGKTALITGAASGIGRATSTKLAEANSNLILVDINEKKLESTEQEIKQLFPSIHLEIHTCDLASKNNIDQLWKRLSSAPDILINNAGSYPEVDFLTLTDQKLREVLDINFSSVVWMCQNFIRHKRSKGNIINIASIEALMPFKTGLIPYAASKAAVIALTRSLAREYGKKGLRVNVVVPGGIKTPGTKKLIRAALGRFRLDLIETGLIFKKRLPLKRWGQTEEIANVILFLASELASYIQGAVIPVDGGFLSA